MAAGATGSAPATAQRRQTPRAQLHLVGAPVSVCIIKPVTFSRRSELGSELERSSDLFSNHFGDGGGSGGSGSDGAGSKRCVDCDRKYAAVSHDAAVARRPAHPLLWRQGQARGGAPSKTAALRRTARLHIGLRWASTAKSTSLSSSRAHGMGTGGTGIVVSPLLVSLQMPPPFCVSCSQRILGLVPKP